MTPKYFTYVLSLLVLFSFHSPLSAKTAKPIPQPTPLPEKRRPIECRWTTLYGMEYYYSNIKVEGRKGLEDIIKPLNDPEANRLLGVSKDAGDAGVAFLAVGIPLVAGGLVTEAVDTNNIRNGADTQQVVGLAILGVGLIGDYIGFFKMQESRTSEFNAVERYNTIVHGDNFMSMNPTPPRLGATLLALKF